MDSSIAEMDDVIRTVSPDKDMLMQIKNQNYNPHWLDCELYNQINFEDQEDNDNGRGLAT